MTNYVKEVHNMISASCFHSASVRFAEGNGRNSGLPKGFLPGDKIIGIETWNESTTSRWQGCLKSCTSQCDFYEFGQTVEMGNNIQSVTAIQASP